MVIIETPLFTKRIVDILNDGEYKEFQQYIVANPDLGDIIPGSGGLRKIRWSAGGKGKRGGARVIYYWYVTKEMLLMLFVFRKNERTNLTKEQINVLREIVKKEYV